MKKLLPLLSGLKEAVILILKFIGSCALIFLALLLTTAAVMASIGWYFATIRSKKRKAREIFSRTSNFFFLLALSIDHFGNVACGGYLNWLLLKEESVFPFGVPGESVSEILGWNHEIDNLSEWGVNLRKDLDFIDSEHCHKAMIKSLFNAKYIMDRYKAIQHRIETVENTKAFMAKYN